MRSSLWARENARARHQAAEPLFATVCTSLSPPQDLYCTHVCRRDQTLLHSFPRVLSPDYIQTQYVLFSDFPGPRWQRGAVRGRPALVWKLQTCSCHWVSLWLWFYCVTYGSRWVRSCTVHGRRKWVWADELSSFLDAGAHQFMLWLYYMRQLRNSC